MKAYLLAIEIDPVEIKHTYAMLPLHSTLVHWFWLDEHERVMLTEVLRSTIESLKQFTIVAGNEDTFTGHTLQGTVPVTVNRISDSQELTKLHFKVCAALDSLTVKYSKPEYIREGYNAHATQQTTGIFKEGSTHECKSVFLVEAASPEYGSDRYVVERFDMKSVS